MKKILCFLLSLIIIFFVICNKKHEVNNRSFKERHLKKEEYSIDKSMKKGYVVNLHGDIKNYEKLESFRENLNSKIKDKIKIVSYTDEGDPIITDLIYNGKSIRYISDNTLDDFGTPEIIIKETRPEDFYSNDSGYFLKIDNEDILILPLYESDSNLALGENTFIGVIIEKNENLAIVEVQEGDILASSDKVIVDLSQNKDLLFEVGTKVKVKHSGIIRESYPAQIDILEIELK